MIEILIELVDALKQAKLEHRTKEKDLTFQKPDIS